MQEVNNPRNVMPDADVSESASDDVFIFPASFAQQRLWFLDKLEPGQSAYNVPFAVRLSGSLNVDVLERSLREITQRHELLRTTFHEDETGKPIQVVTATQEFALPLTDLRNFPSEEREERARSLLSQHSRLPFDLQTGPLIRAKLLRLGDEDHIFSLVFHHVVVDGWSWSVVLREIASLYQAFLQNQTSPLPPLALQYGDYATWQRDRMQGEHLSKLLDYWRRQLDGAPPILELPADFQRPVTQTYRGEVLTTVLPKTLLDSLQGLAAAEGGTLFMVLLAAFSLLLSRYSRQDDIVVGTPIAGRNRSELEQLIGFFVNTLAFRTDLSGDPSFQQLLQRVREVALGAFAHQELPFEKLVEELRPERRLNHTPLFQAMLFLQNTPRSVVELPGLTLSSMEVSSGTAKFDLMLSAFIRPDGLRLGLTYNVDLFRASTMQAMLAHFQNLLESIVANPDRAISSLALISGEEREQSVYGRNNTIRTYAQKSVHELFEAQAERTPNAIAVALGDQGLRSPLAGITANRQVTYSELNQKANQLAHYLAEQGVRAGSLVGICMERSLEMLIAVLATIKAGAAYVPLDPEYPRDRVAFMLQDADTAVLLTQDHVAPGLPTGVNKVVNIDSAWRKISKRSSHNPGIAVTLDNLVYVIYTSGSTGRPKGVCLPHRALANLLFWQLENSNLPAGSRTLQFTSLSFDVSFQEIFSTWCGGGTLVLISESLRRDAVALLRQLREQQVARLFLPFVALQQLAEIADEEQSLPGDLREVITAGEQLQCTRQIVKLFQRLPGCTLFNHYGPSETHVVTSFELARDPDVWEALPPIGKPIANTQIYILDQSMNPVPTGVSGELYVGGIALARGYLNRTELTAERFVRDPFRSDPQARLYKTGDLCRYLFDGNIQYLGRTDNQVKVRGFRIELGEIESLIAKHPSIQHTVVIVREDVPGDKRLVAYVVPGAGHEIDTGELRSFLKQSVPDYMLPSTFVKVESLPLTPSGKVNRRGLPVPDGEAFDASEQFVGPRTLTEELVTGIWKEVLRRNSVSLFDNFFAAGGHSLLATQVVSRIRRVFHVDLPLRAIFEHPTISELAPAIDRARRGPDATLQSIPLVRQPRTVEKTLDGEEVAIFPLSFAQQRLWLLDRLEPSTSAYNLSLGLRLQGQLDVQALKLGLEEIVRRHEVLRARFQGGDGEPQQRIGSLEDVPLPIVDLSRDVAPEIEARTIVRQESQRPFDLQQGPLLRAVLLKLASEDHVLLITMHHIVFDGWSRGVFLRELSTLYQAYAQGKQSPLPELAIQYTDFAVWQREYLSGDRLERHVNYWKQQLAGAPPHLDLPADRSRPTMQTFHGAHLLVVIPGTTAEKLRELSRVAGGTLFMTLLGSFSILMARYSGQEDIVIGAPIAGRNRSETEKLIGFFVNALPMRTDLSKNPSFDEVLRRVRETTLDAYAYQDLAFEKLVEEIKPERDLSRNPIFQVMFALQNVPDEHIDLAGLKISPFRSGQALNAKFDLSVMAVEHTDGISATFEYNTDLFEAGTIERMQQHWLTLLEAVVENPNLSIAELPLLPEAERHQLLVEWNNTTTDFAKDVGLHELVETQVERTPDATALVDGTVRVSYSQLNGRANQLARRLQNLGVSPGILVAVCTERCSEMVIALLAVLKAGGAYVPLDPVYPKNRLANILEDSQARVLITEQKLLGFLPPHSAEVVCLDREWPDIAAAPEHNLEVALPAKNLAYVLFTSGSTGRPKGVSIEHSGASILVQWAQTVFTAEELAGTLFSTSICFDLSVFEMFVPLSVGGEVIIAQNALSLCDLPAASEVRLVNTVPSAMAELLRMKAVPSSVLTVNLAGEALPPALARDVYEQTCVRKLYNLYGPTEDTTYSTYTLVPRDGDVTIGRPIANTQAYILDAWLKPVPIGVAGELHLAGDGLARGYFGRPDLTAERFLANPFSDVLDARMYRTGDRCRYRPDGRIEYLERIDSQIKLRGFRIELGEIENLLIQHPGVQQAVVTVREDLPGDQRLVAYIVAAAGPDLTLLELGSHLRASLPEYMVPSAFVMLDTMPLTANGKVDRRVLPVPDTRASTNSQDFVAPRTPTEKTLAAIWTEVLRRDGVGIHQDFFALGGHSLLATQVISRIRTTLSLELPLRASFEHRTIAELAKAIDETSGGPVFATEQKIAPAARAAFRAKRSSL